MDWSKGYVATYYMEIVDADSWRGIQRHEIQGGKISRTADGLRQSADVDVREVIGEKYIRIWMDARQSGGDAHVALFTGLTSQPETEWEGYVPSRSLTCYSVLKAADDIDLQRGWYAPAGVNSGMMIKRLLSATPAPVVIAEGAPDLKTSIIAEDAETRVTMVDKILTAIGWRLRILGDGTIEVRPQADAPLQKFSVLENDSIEPKIRVTDDWFSCPNVVQCIADDLTAVVRDDNPNSPLSTVNRNREIWLTETDCDLADNESIGQYAWRLLKEEQSRAFTVEYDRRYDPNLYVGDVVELNYPKHFVVGKFRIESQSVTLGHNATTGEEVIAV